MTMCTVAMAQISVSWTKSISGQKITGISGLYTVSTSGFNYEIHSWDATGNHTKLTQGTIFESPKVLSFNDKILLSGGQGESVKIMNSTGVVLIDTVVNAHLSIFQMEGRIQYFHTGNSLVRVAYTTQPGQSGTYSTKVETFTDNLVLTNSVEYVGMRFTSVSGNFLAGNMNGKGKLLVISDTSISKEFTSAITGITEKDGNLFVLADKLYKFDNQLVEVWNKSITGSAVQFIGDKPVVFNGSTAVLYDNLFTSSLFTLTVSQVGMVGINATSDAIYLATGSSLSKIVLGSSPDGIEDLLDESSIILYPNPTTSQITITGADNVQREIINTAGQTLVSTNHNTIDVSFLPAGLYFCRIDGLLTRQFVKRWPISIYPNPAVQRGFFISKNLTGEKFWL